MTRYQLDLIRARLDGGFQPSSLDAALLLAEVERLTAERDAAFSRGVAAMRERLAAVFDADVFPFSREVVRKAIRALPDPEDR